SERADGQREEDDRSHQHSAALHEDRQVLDKRGQRTNELRQPLELSCPSDQAARASLAHRTSRGLRSSRKREEPPGSGGSMVSERQSWRSVVVQNHKWPAFWADHSEKEGYL